MEASNTFKKAIYSQPNYVVEEFYERSVGLIFEKEEDDVRIEARCWSNSTLSGYQRDEDIPLERTQSTTTTASKASSSSNSLGSARVSHTDNLLHTAASRPTCLDGDNDPTDIQSLQRPPSNPDALTSDPDNVIDLDISRLADFIEVSKTHCLLPTRG